MRVLIVVDECDLGVLWRSALRRLGASVEVTSTQDEAASALLDGPFDVIILDLFLTRGSAFAIADLASYRRPEARVVFVTSSSFFSDGAVFGLASNARAFVPMTTPPDDLAAMVSHYATR